MFSWRILTIGHLSRNRFWGESEDLAYRQALASATLIQGNECNILVDPSLEISAMTSILLNRRGLKPEDIDIVYSTHLHQDHWVDFDQYRNADCYMASRDLETLLTEAEPTAYKRLVRFKPASGELLPGIELIPLPGHTKGICGLRFEAAEGRILISGDAVMTQEFCEAGIGYFYCEDSEQAAASVLTAASSCDIVVPGHGDWFLTACHKPR